jgi:hypothetical protein
VKLLNLDDVAVNPAHVVCVVNVSDEDHGEPSHTPVISLSNGQTITSKSKSYADLVILLNEALRG